VDADPELAQKREETRHLTRPAMLELADEYMTGAERSGDIVLADPLAAPHLLHDPTEFAGAADGLKHGASDVYFENFLSIILPPPIFVN
jgi:hypothetical protein